MISRVIVKIASPRRRLLLVLELPNIYIYILVLNVRYKYNIFLSCVVKRYYCCGDTRPRVKGRKFDKCHERNDPAECGGTRGKTRGNVNLFTLPERARRQKRIIRLV